MEYKCANGLVCYNLYLKYNTFLKSYIIGCSKVLLKAYFVLWALKLFYTYLAYLLDYKRQCGFFHVLCLSHSMVPCEASSSQLYC